MYSSAGSTACAIPCDVDHYCIGGRKFPCPGSSTTNGATGQAACVMPCPGLINGKCYHNVHHAYMEGVWTPSAATVEGKGFGSLQNPPGAQPPGERCFCRAKSPAVSSWHPFALESDHIGDVPPGSSYDARCSSACANTIRIMTNGWWGMGSYW
jgi:hypothetical protein